MHLSTDEDDNHSTDIDAASDASVADSESELSFGSGSDSDIDELDAAFDDVLDDAGDYLQSEPEANDVEAADEHVHAPFPTQSSDGMPELHHHKYGSMC